MSAAFTGAEQQRTSHADDLKTFLEKTLVCLKNIDPQCFSGFPSRSHKEKDATHTAISTEDKTKQWKNNPAHS